jgi:hypothetical protein
MMATSEQREARYDRAKTQHQREVLISKLRWMGLEQEADRMTAAGETPACQTVPAETD